MFNFDIKSLFLKCKKPRVFKSVLIFVLSILFCLQSSAQSVYIDFGQNRIQYRNINWKVYPGNSNVRVLYYENNSVLAKLVQQIAQEELQEIEHILSYKSAGLIQLLAFASMNDYRQSNIGYSNPQWNTGGYTVFPNDAGSLSFSGDYRDLRIQIRKNLSDIVLREMIYGGTLHDRFERMRTPALPYWFTSGLSEFIANGWTAEDESNMRDVSSMKTFSNFNLLSTEQQTQAGKSVWRFIIEKFGIEALPGILFIARYTNSAEIGILFHTKKTLSGFFNDWSSFYQDALLLEVQSKMPEGATSIPRKLYGKNITSMALNSNGTKVAIVTNDHGKYKLWVHDLKSASTQLLSTGGQKVLNQITDYQFPRVKWKNNRLFLMHYQKGRYQFNVKNSGGKTLFTYDFSEFESVYDFDVSANGDTVLVGAVKNNQADLYLGVFTAGKFSYKALTHDFDFESSPVIGRNKILFVKHQPGIENKQQSQQNLFEITKGGQRALTNIAGINKLSDPIIYNDSVVGFLSDHSGMKNAWAVQLKSGALSAQTNYRRTIISQQVSADNKFLIELLRVNGVNTLFTSVLSENPFEETVEIKTLPWKQYWSNPDSILNLKHNKGFRQVFRMQNDSTVVQTIDSINRNFRYQTGFEKQDFEDGQAYENGREVKPKNYTGKDFNPLLPDFILTQSDNSQFSPAYFLNDIPFDVLRNPVVMPLLKLSASDMLRNNTLEAGARINLDLTYSDYYLRAFLLRKRNEHEFYFHRRSRKFDDVGETFRQNISSTLEYKRWHPFDEKFKISGGAGFRNEISVLKASEKSTLNTDDFTGNYATLNAEMVYDNTISEGLNTPKGIRGKMSISTIQGLNVQTQITHLQADIRYYKSLYKGINLAVRCNAAYQPGKSKIVYYLGGVENWTARNQMATDVRKLQNENYPFMQWVSGIRGFSRGARIGSNFLMINSELRIPVVKMFRKLPINNEFFRNFTITGFADAGTAFTGNTPADVSNPFNTIFVSSPNYQLSVTARRNPWIAGIGFGMRTRILGYFVKYDYAWGYSENGRMPGMGYFSLGLDF